MVQGVVTEYTREIEINGVGYRASEKKKKISSNTWIFTSSRNGRTQKELL